MYKTPIFDRGLGSYTWSSCRSDNREWSPDCCCCYHRLGRISRVCMSLHLPFSEPFPNQNPSTKPSGIHLGISSISVWQLHTSRYKPFFFSTAFNFILAKLYTNSIMLNLCSRVPKGPGDTTEPPPRTSLTQFTTRVCFSMKSFH